MKKLYVEASLSGAAHAGGWGAVLTGPPEAFGGVLRGPFAGQTTMMELYAIVAAFEDVLDREHPFLPDGEAVVLAMRSTPPLAILRWVFPDAPCTGRAPVEMPRRIVPALKTCSAVYELSDMIEAHRIQLHLEHVGEDTFTAEAKEVARGFMLTLEGAA